MDMTPWQILFSSFLGIMLVAMFGILFRQGQSPTRKEAHEMQQQLREELRAEVQEAVRAGVVEVTAEMSRQMAEVHRRIDQTNQRIDQINERIDQTNERIDQTNERTDRVLSALASHEHIDGRVMITVLPEAEAAPNPADN